MKRAQGRREYVNVIILSERDIGSDEATLYRGTRFVIVDEAQTLQRAPNMATTSFS